MAVVMASRHPRFRDRSLISICCEQMEVTLVSRRLLTLITFLDFCSTTLLVFVADVCVCHYNDTYIMRFEQCLWDGYSGVMWF